MSKKKKQEVWKCHPGCETCADERRCAGTSEECRYCKCGNLIIDEVKTDK